MKAYFLSLNPNANALEQWDAGFVLDIFKSLNAEIISVSKLTNVERAIVVIPARHHAGLEADVNKELQKINHCVLFLLGDEEADYDVGAIEHPSIHIWVQNPHPKKHDKYNKLGTGYPTHLKDTVGEYTQKELDLFFAGQMTHSRRMELVNIMTELENYKIEIKPTKGFTQGLEPEKYYEKLSKTKIAPAPSGAIIPDSFRLFEALECMAIPIADQKTADGTIMEYWDWLFDTATPFPKITEWDRLFGLVPEILEDYPRNVHQQTCWWLLYKRNMKNKIARQYYDN